MTEPTYEELEAEVERLRELLRANVSYEFWMYEVEGNPVR